MVVIDTDPKLIAAAAAGDDLAMRALFDEYNGLMRRIAHRYFWPGASADDVMQEARIGFYKAVRDFDPNDGTPFPSFANLAVQRQIITALKTARRLKHEYHNRAYSLDAPLGDEEGSSPLGEVLPCPKADDAAAVAEREALRAALIDAVMDAKLSDVEAEALFYRAHGLTYQETADKMGRPVKAIDNALQRLNTKLKRILPDRLAPFLAA